MRVYICLICSSLTLTARLKPTQLTTTTTKFGQFNGENDDHITSARASVYYRVTFLSIFFFALKKNTRKKHFSHSKTIDFSFFSPQSRFPHDWWTVWCCSNRMAPLRPVLPAPKTAYCCHPSDECHSLLPVARTRTNFHDDEPMSDWSSSACCDEKSRAAKTTSWDRFIYPACFVLENLIT